MKSTKYTQKLTVLRADIQKNFKNKDVMALKKSVADYGCLLREMLVFTSDERQKTVLRAEVEKCKKITEATELGRTSETEWVTEIFERNLSATIVVESDRSCATGFFITEDGWALTNYHVVDGAEQIAVRFSDGNDTKRASVLAFSKFADVALLKVEDLDGEVQYVRFIDDYDLVKPGASMVVIGNALSEGLAPISGTIKFARNKKGDLIYTAPSNVGDSGAPVFNRNGFCIGINKSATIFVKSGGEQIGTFGLTNATPSDKIKELLNDWGKRFKFKI